MRFLTSVHPFVCALIDPANAKGMLIPVPFSALFLLVHFTNQSNLLPSGRNYFHKAAASQKTENPPLLQRPFVCCSLVASADYTNTATHPAQTHTFTQIQTQT
ncbi:MAG: hypothetical protein BYD32DRAFT_119007 [Podila humilis]|nr:MAG: hypothetical protein BYD32DRAFT_119007 [Podila humilis]